MKKLGLILITLLVPFFGMCQNSAIENLFEKYQGTDGFTTVLVTEDAIKLASAFGEAEGELDGLTNIKFVKVLAQDDEIPIEGLNFYDELKNGMDFKAYKELIVVKEKDTDVWVMAKENDGRIAELLVVVGGDENVLVWIEGDFTMEELASLGGNFGGIDELDILKEL